MSDPKAPWYRIGYALELARQRSPSSRNGDPRPNKNGAGRIRKKRAGAEKPTERDDLFEQLVGLGSGVAVKQLLGALPKRRPGRRGWLLRAAVAGAGAAAVLALYRRYYLDADVDPVRDLLAGAGRGILYGSVVEPHMIGTGLFKGVTYGALEYAASPWGGMDGLLGAASPHRTVPMLGALLGADALEAESITEELLFGTTLGVLYGVARASSGSVDAE